MPLSLEVPAQYSDARECIEAAHRNLQRVRQLLSSPSEDAVDASAAVLREVEVQLGCVAALWRARGGQGDRALRPALEEIQREVAMLAEFFAQSSRLLDGWMSALRTKRSGYDERGQAAPLVLVNQVDLKG